MGFAQSWQVKLDDETAGMLKSAFIAFDTEATGLDPRTDRIIELGAVLFENGLPVKSFSSLVNCGLFVRPSAQNVNHISNEDLMRAPREPQAYQEFLDFLGDAAKGKILMCAHNAKFDMTFLTHALERCKLKGEFYYLDTLSLSRMYLTMPDYKQQTIAEELGLENENAHRACNDAMVCGRIMTHLLETYDRKQHE